MFNRQNNYSIFTKINFLYEDCFQNFVIFDFIRINLHLNQRVKNPRVKNNLCQNQQLNIR
jgi:hypothetical protein